MKYNKIRFADGVEYFIPPRRIRSHEEEQELFERLEALEKQLYVHTLSYMELGPLLMRELYECFALERTENTRIDRAMQVIAASFNENGERSKAKTRSLSRLINEMTSEFRLLAAPRAWVFEVRNKFINSDFLTMQVEYNIDTTAIQHSRWVDKFTSLFAEILKLKSEFIQDNLGLVGALVKKRLAYAVSLPAADLNQEGTLGLSKAVDKFDYKMGLKFSTYASWWIRHHIQRALQDKERIVRIPVHIYDKQHKLAATQHTFELMHGRAASADDLAKLMGWSLETVSNLLTLPQAFSMDKKMSSDDDDSNDFYAVTPCPDAKDPVDVIQKHEVHERVVRALEKLTPRERAIIVGRFGLGEKDERTLSDIGIDYGLSRERIRQVEREALGKMRRELGQVEVA